MKVVLLLADAAEEAGGKLFVLGGGWSLQHGGGAPFNMALAIKIEVPWTEANRRHTIVASLVNEDGEPVTPIGAPQPLRIQGQLEVGRPPGLPQGMPLDAPLAISVAGVQLPPGGYRWEIEIDDEKLAEASFRVMTPPGQNLTAAPG